MSKHHVEQRSPSTFRTVTSSLTYALPHLAGAIDILVVQQPDGSLRSSPFYVRFGKYSSVGRSNKSVQITVNDVPTDFNMQVGRTGEAYFVEEIEEDAPADVTLSTEDSSTTMRDDTSVRSDQQARDLLGVEGGSSDDDEAHNSSTLSSPREKKHTTDTRKKSVGAHIGVGCCGREHEQIGHVGDVVVQGGDSETVKAATEAADHASQGISPLFTAAQAVGVALNSNDGDAASQGGNSGRPPRPPSACSLEEASSVSPAETSITTGTADISTCTSSTTHSSSPGDGDDSNKSQIQPPSPESSLEWPSASKRQKSAGGISAALAADISPGHQPVCSPTTTGDDDDTTVCIVPAEEQKPRRTRNRLSMSLCWNFLERGMHPEQVSAIFEEHLVDAETFQKDPTSVIDDTRLAIRLGSTVIGGKDALPLVLAAFAYGPDAAAAMRSSRGVEEFSIEASPLSSPRLGDTLTTSMLTSSGDNGEGGSKGQQQQEEASGSKQGLLRKSSSSKPIGRMKHSSSWKDWLSLSWKKDTNVNKNNDNKHPSPLQRNSASSTTSQPISGGDSGAAPDSLKEGDEKGLNRESSVHSSRGGDGGVPLDQEAALLAAALGQASKVQVEEIQGIRRSTTTGKTKVLVKRRAFVPHNVDALVGVLKTGQNTVAFTYGKQELHAYIYLVPWNSKLIVSDVDGTITKSDVLGHLGHLFGYDWTHSGVAQLFARAQANGYCLLFLSSRSIAQASITRDYLHSLHQDGHDMPAGPVLISPDGLFPSLYREVVLRRPQEFKIRCLEDIRSLFPSECRPFFAGFGNRDTDEMSYMAVGVPTSRIFIINSKGELRKACSAVRTSTLSSLSGLVQLADSLFAPLKGGGVYKDSSSTACTTLADGEREYGGGSTTNSPSHHRSIGNAAQEVGDDEKSKKKGHTATVDDVPVEESFNDIQFWNLRPSIVIEDDEAFLDAEATCFTDIVQQEEQKDEQSVVNNE